MCIKFSVVVLNSDFVSFTILTNLSGFCSQELKKIVSDLDQAVTKDAFEPHYNVFVCPVSFAPT